MDERIKYPIYGWLAVWSTFFALLIGGCYTKPVSRTGTQFRHTSKAADFLSAISEKTIVFGSGVGRDSQRDGFYEAAPGVLGGQRSSMGFPLNVRATLLTEEVLRAAEDFYAEVLEMNPPERKEFGETYASIYELEEHFLIWIHLRTNFSDDYLRPERWVIFIEDDDGNQYEPAKVVKQERAQPIERRIEPWRAMQVVDAHFGLLYPRSTFDGKPVLPERGNLKLVFMNPTKPTERAQGAWRL